MGHVQRLLCVFAMSGGVSAQAAVFVANTPSDLIDLLPGNGFCSVLPQPGPGPCSLRAAVIEANALAGVDRIDLLPSMVYRLTIAGIDESVAYTGDLDINGSVQIVYLGSQATRPTVDANGLERAFMIADGNVSLLGFDITGGSATVNQERLGGGVYVGDGAGVVTLSYLRMHGNRANIGGALHNSGMDTTVFASEFRDNELLAFFPPSNFGSAILNYARLTIIASSVHGNYNSDGLGGAAIGTRGTDSRLALVDSTVAANDGTGIHGYLAQVIDLRNTTVAGNAGFGLRQDSIGLVRLRNSVIARNLLDCTFDPDTTTDLAGYNLDSDASCALGAASGNQSGIAEPGLVPLRLRGGPTPVVAPLTTSALIDRGHPVISDIGCTAEDQNLVDRPLDGNGDGIARCDIGAVESDDDLLFFDPFERL